MKDNYGRDIYYLRLSVTEKCNYRCVYCMPEDSIPTDDISLSAEELVEIARAASVCGIRKVRVTGGEPLLRPDIIDICREIAAIPGITELCVTTNGVLLPKYAEPLKQAGVKRLNMSLDSLDPETYRKITRRGSLEEALRGVNAAIETGFDAIKLNAVLLGGVNDGEIRELLEMTRAHNVNVRFIEVMPIGDQADLGEFIPAARVLEAAPELRDIGADGVARLYKLPDGRGTVGLISPVSSHFCPTCNRIRVTSDGKLKPCLHSADEIDLRGLRGAELENAICAGILQKPQKHKLDSGEKSASQKNMNEIGG
ncbi:MAG: GTP 3',8-cyclase MoaA [Oscillospiraceae bacterium]|nr:GTP 3',8-cyclase MoaA [Oscillospiraceae bacterium]